MVNINTLLTTIATLYFNNNTQEFIKRNDTFTNLTNFYIIDDIDESALPVVIQSENVSPKFNYFPKCCPPEHVYQAEYRKCVRTGTSSEIYDDLGFNVSLIRSNLQDCEVIVDRSIQEFKLHNFVKNRDFVYDNEAFSHGSYCLDKTLGNGYVARLCHSREYCSRDSNERNDWCLKKCCADGYVLIDAHTCISHPELGLNVTNQFSVMERNDSMALFTDKRECDNYQGNKKKHQFTIKANGNFLINERGVWNEYQVNDLKYCMETYFVAKRNKSANIILICSTSTENDIKFQLGRVSMIISCIAIFITISVYVFVYKLKKIIQRIIVSYCTSLMFFYILALIIISIPDLGKYCEPTGFLFFFSYISSFSWMNVMCFDIYRTVGSMKTTWSQSRIARIKKMTYYTIYALFVSSAITLFLYMGIKQVYEVPSVIRPEFIPKKCVLSNFVEGKYGHILYSVIPVGILITVNIIFFTMTLRYYLKAKSDLQQISRTAINGRDKKLEISRKKIFMVLKLTLVMGFSWIFEVIPLIINFRRSTALQVLEGIFDTFNGLQGLFIFLIFLAKWTIIESVITKLHLGKVLKKNKVCATTSQIEPSSSLMMTELQTIQ